MKMHNKSLNTCLLDLEDDSALTLILEALYLPKIISLEFIPVLSLILSD